jgi:hypothetical protein
VTNASPKVCARKDAAASAAALALRMVENVGMA